MPPISSDVAIGRRTKGSEMLMLKSSRRARGRTRAIRGRGGGRYTHMHARLQTILVAGDHALVQGEAGLDDGEAVAFVADRELPNLHGRVRLHHIRERT